MRANPSRGVAPLPTMESFDLDSVVLSFDLEML